MTHKIPRCEHLSFCSVTDDALTTETGKAIKKNFVELGYDLPCLSDYTYN